MFVIAHRGASMFAPENTIPSFLKAVEVGADFVELDVRSSKDGALVIIHDDRVDRTTNAEGFVSEFTLKQLKSLDAGGWFKPEFKGVKIPTLEEVLTLLKGEISAVVEVKEIGLEDRIIDALRSFNMVDESMIIAPLKVCRKIRLLEPRIPVQVNLDPTMKPLDAVNMLMRELANIASIHIKHLTAKHVRICHRKGLLVNAWPVNTLEGVYKCMKANVDFITTDNPALVVKALLEKGVKSTK